MKQTIFLTILAGALLLGQSTKELMKKAKEAGITTEAQAREMAKKAGMTDAQIDSEMKKRNLTPSGEEAAAEKPQVEPVEAPPAEAVVEPGTPEAEAPREEILPVVEEEIPAAVEEEALPLVGEEEAPAIVEEEVLPLVGEEEEVPIVEEEEIPTIGEEELTIQEEKELEDIEEVSLESQLQSGKKGLTYFGYDVFKGDPAVFQASTLGAIDPHYSIGPGDQIIIMLWGETQFARSLQ